MKKGAVAGAIVWSTPVLMSTPAFAASAECGGSKPCTKWYAVKFENSNCIALTGNGDPTCGNLLAQLGCGAPVTLYDGTPPPAGDTVNPCGNYVTGVHRGDGGTPPNSATVTYNAGVVPLFFQLKPGGGSDSCYTYEWNGTTFVPTTLTGTAPCTAQFVVTKPAGKIQVDVTWPGGSTCKGLSHVSTYFCI